MTTARQKGADFEQLACQFLTTQGLAVIATNYAVPKIGEIDIIATHDVAQKSTKTHPTLVFVEVKVRTMSQFAQAVETVTLAKQRKLIKTAEHFLQTNENYADFDCRFDVVAFQMDEWHRMSVDWRQGAFWVE
ncbi:MAG: YraN family protein [Moraxella sp.]|nr:YraN family protein [Moraxella sp.]